MHDMRVLSISAQKPDSTGSGVFLAQTTEALLRAGHDTAVIAGVSPTDQPVLASGVAFYPVVFETDELPFPVVGMSDEMPYHATRYCDMNPAMVAAFRDSFECVLLRAVNEFDPDLIVCHHLYLLSAHVRMLVSDRVVIAVSHSTELRQMRKHDLERAAIVAGVRDLDLILALHAAQKREIIELFDVPEDKVQVIGTGYNDRMFCASPHASSVDAIEKPLTLAYAGKIWEKKGVPCLIRSLDLLPSEHDSCTLKLAGGYASEEEYRAFVELGAASSHSVEFLGKLTQTDLAKLYREASLFVLPSFFEGLPLVVVEALACGCKVVVTDLPGIRQWIEESIPNAPVVYVDPPALINSDEPVQGSLPAFEARLADAIMRCIEMAKPASIDLRKLSWDGLAKRIVSCVSVSRSDANSSEV